MVIITEGAEPTAKARASTLLPLQVDHASEGFYRWVDVTFEWAKALDNEYERRAVTSLVHKKAITKPNHPLSSTGASGDAKPATLYKCQYADDGKLQLCYSLDQVQYLQHYIFESGLSDPNHVNNRTDPAANPEDDEKPVRRIPLPADLIPAEKFKSVDPSKYDKKLRQESKRAIKADMLASLMQPVRHSQDESASNTTTPLDAVTLLEPSAPLETAAALHSAVPLELTPPLGYFELAQYAVLLAHSGGLKAVQEQVGEKEEQLDSDPATGRGLFIAIYAREQPDCDGNPVLKDVGFDAVYFVENPDGNDNLSDTDDICTEVRDREHWLVQEELGLKGAPAPYQFKKEQSLSGGSLPKPRASIATDFQKKLGDLWERAGKGPIYILSHSVDSDHLSLDTLGIHVDEIDTRLHNFANSSSNGNKFMIVRASVAQLMREDTARLFGEVENTAIVHNWDADTLQDVRAWLAPQIAKASVSAEPRISVPGPTSAATMSQSTNGVKKTPSAHDKLVSDIVKALTDASMEGHHHEPHSSMAPHLIDDDDSDWEDGGQFMVIDADGELVAAVDDE
ncbi:hypothetical protein CspeluHIS016_0403420 [Cutaneotrichosporon spelunceum]|uniref:Uncharacterized protein n=1 Tax=Cutaneotrichosporon spelunceum TaxID=1672016 RepID=A0AAD3TV66_9TREE|nr:hypothetical protein CspeluHIS016_0403420 [Cutaneotrichosporon spelunceum]